MYHADPLRWLRVEAQSYACEPLANAVLDEPKFAVWSGSGRPEQHHYGKGGLVRHTVDVWRRCMVMNRDFAAGQRIPDKLLFLAALFHDFGKCWDYRPAFAVGEAQKLEAAYGTRGLCNLIQADTPWEGSEHKAFIHHISRSVLQWERATRQLEMACTPGVTEEEKAAITHAILAHHGRREWGSPVEPQTRLAWLLHLCDALSARLDDCQVPY